MLTPPSDITYLLNPPVTNDALNALFGASWPEHHDSDFQSVLHHSLAYVCAYHGERLVGFVNVAWDGGIHAFLLDTTVHPDWQKQGIGVALVKTAAEAARNRGMHWLHVDYEAHLSHFYAQCGFRPTNAGVMLLDSAG